MTQQRVFESQFGELPDVESLFAARLDPAVLKDTLDWVRGDDERYDAFLNSFREYGVGLLGTTLAREVGHSGESLQTFQINFYTPEVQAPYDEFGNPASHGHSRPVETNLFATNPDALEVARYRMVDPSFHDLRGVNAREVRVHGNQVVDLMNGKKPEYHEVDLGTGLVVVESVATLPNGSTLKAQSHEVHSVGYNGSGVAFSGHVKRGEEDPALSSEQGLHFKGLDEAQAEQASTFRGEVGEEVAERDGVRLAPLTLALGHVELEGQNSAAKTGLEADSDYLHGLTNQAVAILEAA